MDQLSPRASWHAITQSFGQGTLSTPHVQWIRSGPGHSPTADKDRTEAPEQPLIAIVEDDDATAEMLADLLAMSGYRTLQISRAEAAFPAIRAAQPQLVVLDLWLEHRHAGSMVVGMLSIDPATAHIPIVLCSAQVAVLHARGDQILHRVAGVVEKPFAIEALLTTIRGALETTMYTAGEAS